MNKEEITKRYKLLSKYYRYFIPSNVYLVIEIVCFFLLYYLGTYQKLSFIESILLFILIFVAGNLYGRDKHEEGYVEGYEDGSYDQSPIGKVNALTHDWEKRQYDKKKSKKILSGLGIKAAG